MKLLNQLIELLGDEDASLKAALIKAQILAHQLGDEELGRWVEYELRGYPEGSDLPPYRVISMALFGDVSNGVYHYSDHALPVHHLEKKMRERLTTNSVTDSVSTIEEWAGKDNMIITVPPAALGLLSKGVADTYHVQQAWGRMGIGAGRGILTQIRSRLLEFCLKISDRIPADTPAEEVREKAESVGANSIFKNAVFGDNATVVVGSGSISDIRNSVVKNDIQSLLRELRAVGVKQQDLDDLEGAIQSDSTSDDVAKQKWGPMVRNWVGGMVGKAGSTGWDVMKGAAGNILAAAIGAFYGFGS